jgi:hypothetical protein
MGSGAPASAAHAQLLAEFLYGNGLAAIEAKENVDHIELGKLVPGLAMRASDAENPADAIGQGLWWFRFLLDPNPSRHRPQWWIA